MADLVPSLGAPSVYVDRKHEVSYEEQLEKISRSTTLYIGNLSFFTTEEQIHEVFSKCGEIKRIIMGLDRFKKTLCGFCFVEYYHREDALDCVKYINGTKLDERIVRTDLDPGYKDGRNLGRGMSTGMITMRDGADGRDTYKGFSNVPDGAQASYFTKDYAGEVEVFCGNKRKRGREDDEEEQGGPGAKSRQSRQNLRFRERSATPEDD
ncbi:nuclear cap binding complex subunit [Thoreauomyces humboldtii]|nr:nuclear cap binding complex subunit [Thoreauomyces humboldtii]